MRARPTAGLVGLLLMLGACSGATERLTVPALPTIVGSATAPVTAEPHRSTAPASGTNGSRTPVPATTTPAAAGTSTATVAAPSGGAAAALAALPVKGRAPMTGYDRALFGQTWTDDVMVQGGHNGCDTRNDILRRSLADMVLKTNTRGCVVLSGLLDDPYSGRPLDFVRGRSTSSQVQIDHVVALGDSWQTGAQQLTTEQRTDLANDPLELLAVDGRLNQSKGDGDAATWLPPNKAFRCDYIARQIAVKQKYRLWVKAAERDAMSRVLATCPGQPLPAAAQTAVPAPSG